MSNRKGTFKKGQTGNPNGRPRLSPEIKAIRKLSAEYIREIADMILMEDWAMLQEVSNSSTVPPIQRLYAKALLVAERRGDISALEQFLNRAIGKVKEHVEHSGKITLEDLVAGDPSPEED